MALKLERTQEDLLLVVLTFLKKLSVFDENKAKVHCLTECLWRTR